MLRQRSSEVLDLTEVSKKDRLRTIRSWGLVLVTFCIVQIIFILLDGTAYVPRMNDTGNVLGRILQSELFTEWFTIYQFPWFNLVTIVFSIAIIIKAVVEIFTRNKRKSA